MKYLYIVVSWQRNMPNKINLITHKGYGFLLQDQHCSPWLSFNLTQKTLCLSKIWEIMQHIEKYELLKQSTELISFRLTPKK